MVTLRHERPAMAAGILILPLLLARHFIVGSSPGDSDPVVKIMNFYVSHRAGQMTTDYFALMAAIAFLIFITGLRHKFAAFDEAGVLPSISFAAGITATVLLLLAFATDMVLAWKAAGASPTTFQAIWYVGLVLPEVAYIPLGICLAATSGAMILSHAFPRWLAWLGGGTALCLLAATLLPFTSAVEAVDAIGFLLFLVWTLATGIFALRPSISQSQQNQVMRSPAPLS